MPSTPPGRPGKPDDDAMREARPIGIAELTRFWAPLSATWLMMSLEGPFLAAVIARLADPTPNLAAYGVAFAVAILVEAPVILIMSASTALVDGAVALVRLRRFTHVLNVAMTAVQVALVIDPVATLALEGAIGLPPDVAHLARGALVLLLPWPAAIGYRRFYQGLLIRSGRTRRVAYGTVVRLVAMAATGLALYRETDLPGAWVGAAALSVGVLAEALVSRAMAGGVVRDLLATRSVDPPGYRAIARFYAPLALTSVLALAVQPLVTFFVGGSRLALESLAVLPVVNGLTFIFRSVGLSFQEVAIAVLARGAQNVRPVVRFAAVLGVVASAGLALVAVTPLHTLWFATFSGLPDALVGLARVPTTVLAVLPFLSVALSLERAFLVHARETGPVTSATILEVTGIAALLVATIHGLGWIGANAAAVSIVGGRLLGNVWLVGPCRRVAASLARAPRPEGG